MSLKELIELLGRAEIEFGYKGTDYYICPIMYQYEINQAHHYPEEYDNLEDMLNFRMHDGKKLRDVVEEIELY